MNPIARAVRLGLSRGWIEFKQYLHEPQEMIWTLLITGIFIVVLWFQRGSTVEGMSLALLTLPSLLGMLVANGGFAGTAGTLSYDREDGTLLRAKATPQGMVGYLVARILYIVLTTLISLVLLFIPSAILVGGDLAQVGIDGAFIFIWVFLLGLFATAPWGAMIGSFVKSSNSGFGLTFFPMILLVAISGIFYPISALAGWVQAIAQIFPVYWLGLGMRSVFLPESAVVAEIGGSWRPVETTLVLAIWAIIGFILAPRILRHMAKRESGATMQSRKQQVMQRGY